MLGRTNYAATTAWGAWFFLATALFPGLLFYWFLYYISNAVLSTAPLVPPQEGSIS
ncbi:hypothetical protein Holit_00955 [Hollandina sp. SP2]